MIITRPAMPEDWKEAVVLERPEPGVVLRAMWPTLEPTIPTGKVPNTLGPPPHPSEIVSRGNTLQILHRS